MQCAYRSKFCAAPRAVKLDGSLHKLCDFHRLKANANQQRLHRRKKRLLEEQGGSLQSHSPRARKTRRLRPESPQSATEPIDGTTFQSGFDLLEVKILEVLLFDAEDSTRRELPELQSAGDLSTLLVAPGADTLGDAWAVTL